MAEVANELIDEVMKAVQARLGNLEEGQREIRVELRALRGTMQGMQADVANLYEAFGAVEGRISRIERRLDIIDTPA